MIITIKVNLKPYICYSVNYIYREPKQVEIFSKPTNNEIVKITNQNRCDNKPNTVRTTYQIRGKR